MIIVIILIVILLIVAIWLFIKWRFINPKEIKNMFNELSICVTGKRGKGKDTLMSFVSYGIEHNSNVPLQMNTNLIKLSDLMIPNLYRQILVNDCYKKIIRSNYSKFDNMTFISDAGIFFPSYDDSSLKKEYPNLAITYAIWRHLFDAPLHFNVQNFDRLWKILREQIEDTICCLDIKWILGYAFMHVRYYESPKDCINQCKPLKHSILHRSDVKEVEESRRYIIKDYILLIPKRYINHDSKYFRKVVFKEDICEEEKQEIPK